MPAPTSEPRTALYLRVSTERQADRDLSVPAQERLLREHADRHGWMVVAVYRDEGISGRTDDRPGFQSMIADARAGRFSRILVWKFSRFARSRYHSIVYKTRLRRECNVDVVSASEPIMEGPFGQAVEGFIESLDQAYSEILAEEVRRGMTEAVRRGRRPGGIPPYGFRMIDAVMEVREDEAAVIRMIADLRTREGLGLNEIANRLNAQGIRTRRGTAWRGNTIHQVDDEPEHRGRHPVVGLLDRSTDAGGAPRRPPGGAGSGGFAGPGLAVCQGG